jgi:hypothetical protein
MTRILALYYMNAEYISHPTGKTWSFFFSTECLGEYLDIGIGRQEICKRYTGCGRNSEAF